MLKKIKEVIQNFIKKHIVDDDPCNKNCKCNEKILEKQVSPPKKIIKFKSNLIFNYEKGFFKFSYEC